MLIFILIQPFKLLQYYLRKVRLRFNKKSYVTEERKPIASFIHVISNDVYIVVNPLFKTVINFFLHFYFFFLLSYMFYVLFKPHSSTTITRRINFCTFKQNCHIEIRSVSLILSKRSNFVSIHIQAFCFVLCVATVLNATNAMNEVKCNSLKKTGKNTV